MRIYTNKRSKRVLVKFNKHEELHKQGIENALEDLGDIVGRENERIITTGARTGRLYRFNGRDHRASAPGQAPANRTGRLHKSYTYEAHGWQTMTIGEEADYAGFLENGTRRMAPRPHLIVAINATAAQAIELMYAQAIKRIHS